MVTFQGQLQLTVNLCSELTELLFTSYFETGASVENCKCLYRHMLNASTEGRVFLLLYLVLSRGIVFSDTKSLSGVMPKAGGRDCDFTVFVTSLCEQCWKLGVSLWKKALLGCGWYILGLLCQCGCGAP